MKRPMTSKLFERRIDPISGVAHYVLTAKVCEYQQGFYFVNNSMTSDGKRFFLDARAGKLLTVVTEMSENGHTPANPNNYHIDPHPRFTDNEKYIVFTTSELGGCDLVVAVVEELLELTK